MKKIFIFCLMFALALTACAEEALGLPNPVKEYASLEEINRIVGSALCHPAVMGVTDETFSVIETNDYLIAQYTFRVNGLEYVFRCAPVAYEDISGVYFGAAPAFGSEPAGDIEYAYGDAFKLARWFDMNGQYTLCAKDSENVMDEDTFRSIAAEMRDITNPAMSPADYEAYYLDLEGEYQDSFSERAYMKVTADGTNGAVAEVWWADSAFAGYSWKMTLRLSEDGLLYYSDCVNSYYASADSDEGEVYKVLYVNGSGYFSCSEGKLFWDGAEDESCRECVFEKDIPE